MNVWRRLWLRVRPVVRRDRAERELVEEMDYHRERLIEEFVGTGLSRDEARRAARREMGAIDAHLDACRDERGWHAAGDWARQLRLALRVLRRSPGYATVVLASLVSGLTLATIAASLLYTYLQRGLPFPSADRLYHVNYVEVGQPEPAALDALDWTAMADVVEAVDRSSLTRFYAVDASATVELPGLLLSPDTGDLLGVRTVIGRGLQAADFEPRAERVALLGHARWLDRFGGAQDVLGTVVRASVGNQSRPAETYHIVGVLAPGFRYAGAYGRSEIDLVVPALEPATAYLVRLRPEVPAAIVADRIAGQVQRLPDVVSGRSHPRIWLESVHERYIGELRPLFAAGGLVTGMALAVVVSNVTILALLRVMRRQKEVAVRLALGASRVQVSRLFTAEAGILVAGATGATVLMSAIALQALGPLIEVQLGRPAPGGTDAIGLNGIVLAVLAVLGLAVTFVLSVMPLALARPEALVERLRRDQRAGGDRRAARIGRASLMAMEIGGTLALLVGAGLMARSVVTIARTDLGIDPGDVLRSRLALPAAGYGDPEALSRFYARFLDDYGRGMGAPVAVMSTPVLVVPPRQALETERGVEEGIGVRSISPDYFDVLGVGVTAGRAFDARDVIGGDPVAIVSESLARRLWPDGTTIGRRIRTGERPVTYAEPGVWRAVVGVVSDVRQSFLDVETDDVYLPFLQVPSQYAPVIGRVGGTLASGEEVLRQTVADLDRTVLVGPVIALEAEAAQQTARARFLAALIMGASILAAALAMVGLYGITAYAVEQEERDVGVRLALGATPAGIARHFLQRAGALLMIGIGLGLPASVLLARTVQRQLAGVSSLDVTTLACAMLLLAGCSLMATWAPVRRISRRSPAGVLRGQ